MPELLTRILTRLGIMTLVSKRPLTDEEWDQQKVLPLYKEWQNNPPTENDYLPDDVVDALRRGDTNALDEFLKH